MPCWKPGTMMKHSSVLVPNRLTRQSAEYRLENTVTALDAFQMPEQLGDDIVIIGGGEIGMEAAIYLTRMGKQVTVLEQRRLLAMDSTPIHYYSMFRKEWGTSSQYHGNHRSSCRFR